MEKEGKQITTPKGMKRTPAVAGHFYEADSQRLRTEVERYLAEAGTKGSGNVQAVIAPHAGYVFSGGMAGRAFAQVAPGACYKRIFLLGPSHQAAFDGASVNAGCSAYETPLGDVVVDESVCRDLLQGDGVFCYLPEAHGREHCLEVELPFLQVRLDQMPPIVPIIVGTQDFKKLERVAGRLRPYFTADNLFVISSDFSHYPSYRDALRVDKTTGDALLSASVDMFLSALKQNAKSRVPKLLTSACGQAPLLVLLMLMRHAGGLEMEHLGYCNSGDSPYGAKDEVVGYHAFAVRRVAGEDGTQADASPLFSLTPAEKETLLDIARKSISEGPDGGGACFCDADRLTEKLRMDCGAFVTLHVHGRLRGCIGQLVGRQPLYRTVAEMARAAAFDDPRFYPVGQEELPGIQIEISVLSPLRKISSAEEFQLGRHGIFMVKGNRQGTFLPQVADETHWTKEEFLGHCARDKAGLEWDGWREADLYVYEAEVFHEGDGE